MIRTEQYTHESTGRQFEITIRQVQDGYVLRASENDKVCISFSLSFENESDYWRVLGESVVAAAVEFVKVLLDRLGASES